MNVKQFYEETNGSYQNALSVMMNDTLIARLLGKFMSNNSFDEIISCYENKDYRNLFSAVHSFKGVTGNLALTPLYDLSCKITELTRNKDDANIDSEIAELKKNYLLVVEKYNQYLK